MKRILAGFLFFSCLFTALFGALSFSSSADLPNLKYCVIWSFGTKGEYYLDPQRYAVGEIPKLPQDITPTKVDEHRLFHFIGWDRDPEPVKQDTVYYAVYRVAEKKYAMDFDTQVSIADVTVLLQYLAADTPFETLSSPDISEDGVVSIMDVTCLLFYLGSVDQPEISGKALLNEKN